MNSEELKKPEPKSKILSADFSRLNFGQALNRTEERMDKTNMRGVRESPRKRDRNENLLRNKLKKTIKQHSVAEEDQAMVKLMPKFDNMEADNDVLKRRDKQIEFGKNSVDYDKYAELVKKIDRKEFMPRTPNKYKKYTRRRWDGAVRTWKQQLHATVTALEEEMPNTQDTDWKLDDRMSNSWAEEVEAEDLSCIAVSNSSTSSSGQGLCLSVSSTEATHMEVLGADDKVTILESSPVIVD